MATTPAGSRRQRPCPESVELAGRATRQSPSAPRRLTWIRMSEGLPPGDLALIQWHPLVILWYVPHMFLHE